MENPISLSEEQKKHLARVNLGQFTYFVDQYRCAFVHVPEPLFGVFDQSLAALGISSDRNHMRSSTGNDVSYDYYTAGKEYIRLSAAGVEKLVAAGVSTPTLDILRGGQGKSWAQSV
jgi:hypothetical protein